MWLGVAIQVIVLLIFSVALYLWFRRQQQHIKTQHILLEKRLDFSTQQSEQSQHEVEELRAGIIGVGQRVLQLDSALTELSSQVSRAVQDLTDKQRAMELTDPDSKIYSRAMKMVQLGADLEEIMRECELPRAEAELLFNLHQQKK
jgi:uncharacterized protein HemX